MRKFWKNVFVLAIRNKGSVVSSILIIMFGITLFAGSLSALESLVVSRENYLKMSNVTDLHATVQAIPVSALGGINEIPGIESSEGLLVSEIRAAIPESDFPVTLRVAGLEKNNRFNLQFLNEEEMKSDISDDEIYLGYHCAEAYNLKTGDIVSLLCSGREYKFRYAGIVQGPTVMDISSDGTVSVDGESYDIAAISRNMLLKINGNSEIYTDLGINLNKGVRFSDVKKNLEEYLKPYALYSLTDKAHQESIESTDEGQKQIGVVSYTFPTMFLGVSVFLLFAVVQKLIQRDRTILGAMKAFGMSDREMVGAYLFQGAMIGFIGSLLGLLTCPLLGNALFVSMDEYYRILNSNYSVSARVITFSLTLAILTGLLSSYFSVRTILAITPAEAMRAPLPKGGVAVRIKTNDVAIKLGISNVLRYPINGLLIILAIALSMITMIAMAGSYNGIKDITYNHFTLSHHYDYFVALENPGDGKQIEESLITLSGVDEAQAIGRWYGTVSRGTKSFNVPVTVLDGDRLWEVMDTDLRKYELPSNGIILSDKAAEEINVKAGDEISISIGSLKSGDFPVTVKAVVKEIIGINAYMSPKALENLLSVQFSANNVLIKAKDGMKTELCSYLSKAGNVQKVSDAEREKAGNIDDMSTSSTVIQVLMVLGYIAGCIIILCISRINIMDRLSELGTLIILGFPENKIKKMILIENGIYFVLGIMLGLPLSFGSASAFGLLISPKFYIVRSRVTPAMLLLTCSGLMISVLFSSWSQYRSVQKIKLTDILKERC